MTYSWGEFYETTKNCSEYTEEIKRKFAVFEALDKAKTLYEVGTILLPLTQYEIDWLNSPCLDGLIYTRGDVYKIYQKEYLETVKYYTEKKLYFFDLHNFLHQNQFSVISFLVDKTTKVNLQTTLELACFYGNMRTIQLLIEKGATINEKCLMKASEGNSSETIKFLLERGIDIHWESDCALRMACARGRNEVVKLLLENGADIHVMVDEPLRRASENGNVETVRLLLNNGANAHGHNIIYGAVEGCCLEVIKLLLENGATATNDALQRAITYDHPEIVALLLQHGGDKNFARTRFEKRIAIMKMILEN